MADVDNNTYPFVHYYTMHGHAVPHSISTIVHSPIKPAVNCEGFPNIFFTFTTPRCGKQLLEQTHQTSLYTALGCLSLVGFMSTALIFIKLLIFTAILIFITRVGVVYVAH